MTAAEEIRALDAYTLALRSVRYMMGTGRTHIHGASLDEWTKRMVAAAHIIRLR